MRPPTPVFTAPVTGSAGPNYGRPVPYGGPPPVGPYSGGGRGAGAAPSGANSNGYPPFQPPVGRFEMGRGGGRGVGGRFGNGHVGADRRSIGGRPGGGGGRGFDSARGGGERGFDSAHGGGRFGMSRGAGRRDRASGRGGAGGRGGRHGGSSRGDLDNVALPKQDFGNLVPFEKNFYVESLSMGAMSEQEVMLYRSRREITVDGHDIPKPIPVFHETSFPGIHCLCLLLTVTLYGIKDLCLCFY